MILKPLSHGGGFNFDIIYYRQLIDLSSLLFCESLENLLKIKTLLSNSLTTNSQFEFSI